MKTRFKHRIKGNFNEKNLPQKDVDKLKTIKKQDDFKRQKKAKYF